MCAGAVTGYSGVCAALEGVHCLMGSKRRPAPVSGLCGTRGSIAVVTGSIPLGERMTKT